MDRLLFAACLGLSAAAAVATLRLAGWAGDDDGPSTPGL